MVRVTVSEVNKDKHDSLLGLALDFSFALSFFDNSRNLTLELLDDKTFVPLLCLTDEQEKTILVLYTMWSTVTHEVSMNLGLQEALVSSLRPHV